MFPLPAHRISTMVRPRVLRRPGSVLYPELGVIVRGSAVDRYSRGYGCLRRGGGDVFLEYMEFSR